MRALTIALRTLIREWRSGDLGVLLLAITVAVAALTGVGFLVDRISKAVDDQAGEVLAADLRLESARPFDASATDEAIKLRLSMKCLPLAPLALPRLLMVRSAARAILGLGNNRAQGVTC